MRRLLLAVIFPVVLTQAGAGSAPIDHAYVFGGVNVWRGSAPIVAEYGSQYVPCSATTCTVSVALGKRDYGRFVKWCGAAKKDITVAVSSLGGHAECKGPTPWLMDVHVAMRNSHDVLTTHAEPVIITVEATE